MGAGCDSFVNKDSGSGMFGQNEVTKVNMLIGELATKSIVFPREHRGSGETDSSILIGKLDQKPGLAVPRTVSQSNGDKVKQPNLYALIQLSGLSTLPAFLRRSRQVYLKRLLGLDRFTGALRAD